MNKRILVDTSIWVQYFNRLGSKYADRLAELLETEAVCITGIILAELLQGAKTPAEFNLLRNSLKVVPLLKETEKTWIDLWFLECDSAVGKIEGLKISAPVIIQKRFRKRLFSLKVCVILVHRLQRDNQLVREQPLCTAREC